MTATKICDVRDRSIAASCAGYGVALIGLHCIWQPPDGPKRQQIAEVLDAVRGGCKSVLVTRQTDISIVVAMSGFVAWDYLQLHALWTSKEVIALRRELNGLGRNPGLIGVVEASAAGKERAAELREAVDLLLFDSSIRGGTGARADSAELREALSGAGDRPFIIAGGLNPENVESVVREFRPWGVDVQSGVELPGGGRQKDVSLIRSFVEAVSRGSA